MNKHLGEIVDSIEHERRDLFASVSELSQGQMDFRPAEDAWSIGENLDHLHLSEQGVTKLIKLSLSKAAKSDAAARTDDAGENAWLTSLDQYQIEKVTRKLKALEQIVPRAGIAKSEILEGLRRSRAELLEGARAAEGYDLAQISFPHPFLGAFNLYQWIRFVGKHELRHLNQIEAVKRAQDFPAPEIARAN